MAHDLRGGEAMMKAGAQRRRNWPRSGRWSFLGLLLAIAFLTHDALMTVDAHGAAGHDKQGRRPIEDAALGAHGHVEDHVHAAIPCECARVISHDACGVGGNASTRVADRWSAQPEIGMRIRDYGLDCAELGPEDQPVADRARSPGVRQALLQVYRI
jgi:hypothetical protein